MQTRSATTSSDAGPRRARALTIAGGSAFAAASIALVMAKGLILSRDWLFAWLLLGLLAVSLSDPRFLEYRTLVVALATAGFVTYVLFPAVPPWLAAWDHHIEPVPRTLASMWSAVGIEPAHALFENRGEFYNQQAAIPSLHAA